MAPTPTSARISASSRSSQVAASILPRDRTAPEVAGEQAPGLAQPTPVGGGLAARAPVDRLGLGRRRWPCPRRRVPPSTPRLPRWWTPSARRRSVPPATRRRSAAAPVGGVRPRPREASGDPPGHQDDRDGDGQPDDGVGGGDQRGRVDHRSWPPTGSASADGAGSAPVGPPCSARRAGPGDLVERRASASPASVRRRPRRRVRHRDVGSVGSDGAWTGSVSATAPRSGTAVGATGRASSGAVGVPSSVVHRVRSRGTFWLTTLDEPPGAMVTP